MPADSYLTDAADADTSALGGFDVALLMPDERFFFDS